MVEDMKPENERLRLGAQQTLDELLNEDLIPFKLYARVVEAIGPGEYIVRFHDSRLRSVDVSWQVGESFKALVRTAILDRLSRMSRSMWNSRVA
jgi:hypothetical protein